MALDATPTSSGRLRGSTASVGRTSGGLRKPARVTVEQRVLDELHIDYAALRHEAVTTCDYVEPRLDFLHPIAIELGHPAEQIVAGCLYRISQLRKRATA